MHYHTITNIVEILKSRYKSVKCALNHDSAWQLLLATVLSAQCKDERVNQVTTPLFVKYPSIMDIANISLAELEKLIYSTGFYHNKAKNLKAAAAYLIEANAGQVPSQMDELLKIPGVARKTANVILSEWFHINVGVVVDTHVSRITQRLGMVSATKPEKIEQELMQILPQKDWGIFSLLLIQHGRKICDAKKPKCDICPLNKICNYYQQGLHN